MNTDNMSIAGETIDYGPCAFMDAYDPGTVYSSIDTVGATLMATSHASPSGTSRAWRRPSCRCLLGTRTRPSEAQDAIAAFATRFETAYGH